MTSRPWLGVIADDYTGATDIASLIARSGARVMQFLGTPSDTAEVDADCVVVALKSRSIAAIEAVAQSIEAAEWLRDLGVEQLYFKYCSTFDSTDDGNIGPVADALSEMVGTRCVVFVPASPEHGRTTYLSNLFVGSQLLHESPLREHPINPMTDSNLLRVLSRQTSTPVSGIHHPVVTAGATAIRAAADEHDERRHLVVDALNDADIAAIAQATAGDRLVSGGAALGAALAALRTGDADASSVAIPEGDALVLAGSCSAATRAQLAEHRKEHPAFEVDVYAIDRGEDVVAEALRFLAAHRKSVPAVIASSDPETVRRIQTDLGTARSARLVECTLGAIAQGAVELGFRRMLVAGGETSGAIVNSLGVHAVRIGTEVAPGVPWTVSTTKPPLGLLLKSGNFGGAYVFRDALEAATR